MPHSLGIPSIPFPKKETLGPRGNSAKFFCELCNNDKTPEQIEALFIEYLKGIISADKEHDIQIIKNFFALLGYSHRDYINQSKEEQAKLAEKIFDDLHSLEDGIIWHNFTKNIEEKIINKVPSDKSVGLGKIISYVEENKISISNIIEEVNNTEIGNK